MSRVPTARQVAVLAEVERAFLERRWVAAWVTVAELEWAERYLETQTAARAA